MLTLTLNHKNPKILHALDKTQGTRRARSRVGSYADNGYGVDVGYHNGVVRRKSAQLFCAFFGQKSLDDNPLATHKGHHPAERVEDTMYGMRQSPPPHHIRTHGGGDQVGVCVVRIE